MFETLLVWINVNSGSLKCLIRIKKLLLEEGCCETLRVAERQACYIVILDSHRRNNVIDTRTVTCRR